MNSTEPSKVVNTVNTKEKDEQSFDRTMQNHNRIAGQSCTILLRPLLNSITESEIKQFVCRKSLSSPLRIELLKFRCNHENPHKKQNYTSYAFVTFSSSKDCWLVKKYLNHNLLKGEKPVSISFSVIPRTDLEGKTNVVEFGTEYPPITKLKSVEYFLKKYQKTNETNFTSIEMPKHIARAPGHGHIKGKWRLFYSTPEMAKQAVEQYSARSFLERFVIIGYQLSANRTPYDRKECFYGITDRIILRNLTQNITEDDILLFLQSNGFDSNSVIDIFLVHQMTQLLENSFNKRKKKKNRKKFKPKKGYCIISFVSNELATKAYVELNQKIIQLKKGNENGQSLKIYVGFDSPLMADPLKYSLMGKTNVIHLSNMPWNTTAKELKKWLENAGDQKVKNAGEQKMKNTGEQKKENAGEQKMKNTGEQKMKNAEQKIEEDVNGNEDENPFYDKMGENEDKNVRTRPISVYIKYRDGFSTGRANATFVSEKQATICVELLNETLMNGRKISVNWALPIKQFLWKQKRRQSLNINDVKEDVIDGENDIGVKIDDDIKDEDEKSDLRVFVEKRALGKKRRWLKNTRSKDTRSTKRFKIHL